MTRAIDDGGAAGIGPRPPTSRRGRRRALAALLAGAALIPVAWRAWPAIRREVSTRLAERAVDAGRLDEAQARLAPLIEEGPGRARPRLLAARLARLRGSITEAEESLLRAVELGIPAERGRREHALIRARWDFPAAEPTLRRILADHPDDAEVRRALDEGAAWGGR